jgi:hypothetical protein
MLTARDSQQSHHDKTEERKLTLTEHAPKTRREEGGKKKQQ